jgi:transcriptional regulator with XRE-family HTH domain
MSLGGVLKKSDKDFVFSPAIADQIKALGANLKRARVRRRITQQQLADRAFVSRQLIVKIEQGNPSVSLGVLAQVLWCFGLLDDMAALANPDTDKHGKWLEEKELPKRVKKRPAADPLLRFLAEGG